jgi:hypothetical protein
MIGYSPLLYIYICRISYIVEYFTIFVRVTYEGTLFALCAMCSSFDLSFGFICVPFSQPIRLWRIRRSMPLFRISVTKLSSDVDSSSTPFWICGMQKKLSSTRGVSTLGVEASSGSVLKAAHCTFTFYFMVCVWGMGYKTYTQIHVICITLPHRAVRAFHHRSTRLVHQLKVYWPSASGLVSDTSKILKSAICNLHHPRL